MRDSDIGTRALQSDKMLSRIYIDNYRCFQNFEFRPQAMQLILGDNGSGKSYFLSALRCIRDFAAVGSKADFIFTSETRTRWQTLREQTFELEVQGEGGTYLYTLKIDGQDEEHPARVLTESLQFEGKPLMLFAEEHVSLFDDSSTRTIDYPFEADRSALASLGLKRAGARIAWFKQWLYYLYCIQIVPSQIGAEGKEEEDYPEDDLKNFAAWYSHIVNEKTRLLFELNQSLRNVLDGFYSLDLRKTGRTARELRATFSQKPGESNGARKNPSIEFTLDELSDGQKALIALYTLLHCVVGPQTTICIDEPDNFLALPEIQPWLLELTDRVDEVRGQAILISHHPELINLLAPEHGVIFSRTGLGPVRVEPYRADTIGGLSPAERVARGWENG